MSQIKGAKQSQQPQPTETTYTTVGGERYRGNDDYLKSIMDVYRRIGNLSINNERRKALLWDLEYCTDCLINAIIDMDDRDEMATAFKNITQIEYLKMVKDPTAYKNIGELKDTLTESDTIEAGIRACFIIIGESRTYFDRYFGFEQKLEVMRQHDIGNSAPMDEPAHTE